MAMAFPANYLPPIILRGFQHIAKRELRITLLLRVILSLERPYLCQLINAWAKSRGYERKMAS